jgi:hypothetical protein
MADDAPDVVIADELVEAPDEVTNEGDTVVVVVETAEPDSDNNAVEAVAVETNLDHESRITALEMRMNEVESQAAIAAIDAEIALDATENLAEADEAIIEAADDAIVETVENAEIEEGGIGEDDEITTDAIEPVSARVHPMFRSWSEWRNR